MMVNERSVERCGRSNAACSPAPASRRPRTGATGRPHGATAAVATSPDVSSTALLLAASENLLRPSRDKRWMTSGQLPSLIRRRPPEAETLAMSLGPSADCVATSVAGRRQRRHRCTRRAGGTGVAMAHLWRGRCRRSGRVPTPHQALIKPRRRFVARRPTPARP